MARILLLFVIVVAVTGKHHPKFPKSDESDPLKKAVACSSEQDQLRNQFIEKSRCGEPKEVFVDLKHTSSYLQVVPSSVWVKRCVGLCNFGPPGSQCIAIKTRMEAIPVCIVFVELIPIQRYLFVLDISLTQLFICSRLRNPIVRVYNLKTEKETCTTYEVEVHESCGCCTTSPRDCVAPRVFNPRKCSCQCPNMDDRRKCLSKRNQNMRWNRSKCECEKRRTFWS
ncbi:unnamed protein product [Danaus chrysippus]|uniref:(African queen) hypothetical protein n=1 Tax=Danaus chrysippus TaxID=151541 RepID=A0A8J2VRC2_9NEOP|nr:unnamed protein product [Danaus chrysippus]